MSEPMKIRPAYSDARQKRSKTAIVSIPEDVYTAAGIVMGDYVRTIATGPGIITLKKYKED